MGYSGVVVSALALVTFAVAAPSVGDNSLDVGERVLLVAPVLAPPGDTRKHSSARSRQFPILVLLTQASIPEYGRPKPEERSLRRNPQPIYVKRLQDQQDEEAPTLMRQKRHIKKFKGGYGRPYGGGGGGYGYGGGNQGYHGGGCNGGCGGNYGGGGNAYASASATATASASSYGRKK